MRLKVRILREYDPTMATETKRVEQALIVLLMIIIAWTAIPAVQIALRVYTQTGNLASLVAGFVIAMGTLAINTPLICKFIELRR